LGIDTGLGWSFGLARRKWVRDGARHEEKVDGYSRKDFLGGVCVGAWSMGLVIIQN
jgi:hypothetical protein